MERGGRRDWLLRKDRGQGSIIASVLIIVLICAGVIMTMVHTVPPGHRGVVVTFGRIEPTPRSEGLTFTAPWSSVVMMKVNLEKEEVTESTASQDLQEVTTTLAVHFNVNPGMATEVYKNMRRDYHDLLLRPVIQEDLKATTALYNAENLITNRPIVVQTLTVKLRESLAPYGIEVQTVNIVNFAFQKDFNDAIEAKVVAQQDALRAKNYLEQVRWEQEQQIVKQQAQAKMKVIEANATAQKLILEARGEAQRILLEAQAQADAIQMIANSITSDYVRYLYLLEWDGKLPTYMLGSEPGIFLSVPSSP